MKAYTNVSRKTVGEDRVAICPNFGCGYMTRVKPLKMRFFGFGKYPKCKKHHIPLVYTDERIGDFTDAALACLFDKAGLPPNELIESVKLKFPNEIKSFIEGWVYCITVGRGAPIVSRYMDSISNTYLKQLTKKQIIALKKGNSKTNLVKMVIKNGMDEIAIQYTRVLKHLRVHSEVLIDHQKLQPISRKLRNFLKDWQINIMKQNKIMNPAENMHEITLKEIKQKYDQILNACTCRCLLGLNPEAKEIKKTKISAFDRFSAYHEFFIEGLTVKFTKSDITMLYSDIVLVNALNTSHKKISENMTKDEISIIKYKLKKIDWFEVSNCWQVRYRKNQYSNYKIIELDPYKECSRSNPLYQHKDWIERIYNDESFEMSDEKLAKLCNISKDTANYWRKKKHGIKGKKEWGKGRWIDKRSGRIFVKISDDYNHPQLKNDRNYRPEHVYIMEQFLANNPELKISKKYLINGKCLEIECEVHHINFNPQDNNINNLWIYENKKAHTKGEKSIRIIFSKLIKIGCILFSDGEYFFNQHFNINSISNSTLKETKNYQPMSYKGINLNEIKEVIKKINWKEISSEWSVIKRFNQYKSKIINLNPYRDCDNNNPLYMHKGWFSRIYSDPEFFLTDSKIGKICGISKDTVRYWREKVHKISGKKEWGQNIIVDKSDGRIWVRVPKNYANPVVQKSDHHRRIMLEHRYVMEQFLAQHPEWEISQEFLNEGKYLKPECEIHHINLDYQDNRISNLWVFKNNESHQKARKTLYELVQELLDSNIIVFKNGMYSINF